jgi:hypothetical protein
MDRRETMKKKTTTDAVKILRDRYYKDKPERLASIGRERVKARITLKKAKKRQGNRRP